MVHGPMAAGIPAWATRAGREPMATVECEQCGNVLYLDDAEQAMGRYFCDDDCLWDWTADHRDEVLEWLRD